MEQTRAQQWSGVAAIVLVGAGAVLGVRALWPSPPRPDLPMPRGFSVVDVESHCPRHDPLWFCEWGETPHALLTIRYTGGADSAFGTLSNHARAHGWQRAHGMTCADGEGCVRLDHLADEGRLVLAYFPDAATRCISADDARGRIDGRIDAVDCASR